MKFLIATTLLLFFVIPVSYTQNNNLNDFNERCRDIGDLILSEEAELNLSNWCENLALENAQSYILQLRSDITSDEATYSILLLKDEVPIFYTINFYDKNTLEEFGQFFIAFKDKENTLVDNINFISKEQQKENKSSSDTFENIPLPPKPPKIKKKN